MSLTQSIKLRFLQTHFPFCIFMSNLHWKHRAFSRSACKQSVDLPKFPPSYPKHFNGEAKTNIIRSIVMPLSECCLFPTAAFSTCRRSTRMQLMSLMPFSNDSPPDPSHLHWLPLLPLRFRALDSWQVRGGAINSRFQSFFP